VSGSAFLRAGLGAVMTAGWLLAAAAPAAAEQYLVLKNGREHLGRPAGKDQFITCKGAVLSTREATLRRTNDKCPTVSPTMPKGTVTVPPSPR
jgi:hypothetical protein